MSGGKFEQFTLGAVDAEVHTEVFGEIEISKYRAVYRGAFIEYIFERIKFSLFGN